MELSLWSPSCFLRRTTWLSSTCGSFLLWRWETLLLFLWPQSAKARKDATSRVGVRSRVWSLWSRMCFSYPYFLEPRMIDSCLKQLLWLLSLSASSRCSIHVARSCAESLCREVRVSAPPGSLHPLSSGISVCGVLWPQPISFHLLGMKPWGFPAPFFFFFSHSSLSNLSLCFYLALLFILNLRDFIICGLLWDISFIVDEACKLQGSRIEGPTAIPTFLARIHLPWKGLLWGQSS